MLSSFPRSVHTIRNHHPARMLCQLTCKFSALTRNTAAILVFLIALLCLSSTSKAITPFRIGTGGKTGVYYPIGKMIALGLTQLSQEQESGPGDLIGIAQNSAGSIENVRRITQGEVEAGLVQADVAFHAVNQHHKLKTEPDMSSLRAIASLYPEKFQIVVRKDAQVEAFRDLKGKKISVDEPGSGTLEVMQTILSAYEMSVNDLSPLYLKPVFTNEKLKNNEIQGFVMMAGTPMDAVFELDSTEITFLPLDKEIMNRIYQQNPHLFPGKIESGTYPGIPETPTLEVYSLLVVDASMSEDMAYEVTKALFSETMYHILKSGHPQGKSITLDTALNGISIPLHPGARRFYQETKTID